jgi:hypothetical protein
LRYRIFVFVSSMQIPICRSYFFMIFSHPFEFLVRVLVSIKYNKDLRNFYHHFCYFTIHFLSSSQSLSENTFVKAPIVKSWSLEFKIILILLIPNFIKFSLYFPRLTYPLESGGYQMIFPGDSSY